MKSYKLGTIALWVLFFVGLLWLRYYIHDQYREELGTEIIINKDTLVITDYSLFYQGFTLDNGTTVAYDLVKKQKIK